MRQPHERQSPGIETLLWGHQAVTSLYRTRYGLHARPFQLVADHRFFFPSRAHRRALARFRFGLAQGGIVLVEGEPGTGKTMLGDYIASTLGSPRLDCVRLNAAALRGDLLSFLSAEMTDDACEPATASAYGSLLHRLERRVQRQQRTLLIIDEAQALKGADLQGLAELVGGSQRSLQVLLLAQPAIGASLLDPDDTPFEERIVARCRLEGLEPAEMRDFIEHRLRCAGWSGEPAIAQEAVEAVAADTACNPRRVNLLCGRLLVLAALEQSSLIDAAIVHQAVRRGGAGERVAEGPADSAAPGGAESERPAGNSDSTFWREEVRRLHRKLERLVEELARERRRGDDARRRAEEMRQRLARLENAFSRMRPPASSRDDLLYDLAPAPGAIDASQHGLLDGLAPGRWS